MSNDRAGVLNLGVHTATVDAVAGAASASGLAVAAAGTSTMVRPPFPCPLSRRRGCAIFLMPSHTASGAMTLGTVHRHCCAHDPMDGLGPDSLAPARGTRHSWCQTCVDTLTGTHPSDPTVLAPPPPPRGRLRRRPRRSPLGARRRTHRHGGRLTTHVQRGAGEAPTGTPGAPPPHQRGDRGGRAGGRQWARRHRAARRRGATVTAGAAPAGASRCDRLPLPRYAPGGSRRRRGRHPHAMGAAPCHWSGGGGHGGTRACRAWVATSRAP